MTATDTTRAQKIIDALSRHQREQAIANLRDHICLTSAIRGVTRIFSARTRTHGTRHTIDFAKPLAREFARLLSEASL